MSISSASLRASISLMNSDLETPKKPGFARRFLIGFLEGIADSSSTTTDTADPDDQSSYCRWTNSAGDDYYGPVGDLSRSHRIS